jgi:hypothetical protein
MDRPTIVDRDDMAFPNPNWDNWKLCLLVYNVWSLVTSQFPQHDNTRNYNRKQIINLSIT